MKRYSLTLTTSTANPKKLAFLCSCRQQDYCCPCPVSNESLFVCPLKTQYKCEDGRLKITDEDWEEVLDEIDITPKWTCAPKIPGYYVQRMVLGPCDHGKIVYIDTTSDEGLEDGKYEFAGPIMVED